VEVCAWRGRDDRWHHPDLVNDVIPMPDDDRAGSGLAPVVAIARSEVRRRWRALVLIGLLAGLVGATAVSALALARRTTTAYDRLGAVTQVDDARGTVLRHPDLVDDIVGRPEVTERWTGGISVAKIEGENAFLGIVAGPAEPSDIIRPQLIEGHLPGASGDPDVIEVALRDDFQRAFAVPMGTEVPVQFLTEADYFRFDTGFEGGTPNGAELVVRVVGTFRMAGGTGTVPPGLAGPEALDEHPEVFVGSTFFVRLEGGPGAVDAYIDEVAALADGRELPPEGQEFVVASVSATSVAAAAVDNTADLLGRALVALALAAIGVGGFAVAQALARHHTATAGARAVERALGLTRTQQASARLLSGALPTGLAVVLTLVGSVMAARLDPIGGIDLYEPSPGFALNGAIVGIGVLAVGAFVLAATSATSVLARRRVGGGTVRESGVVERATRWGGSPETVLGLRFAFETGRGARAVPVRSAITGAVVGLGGVVAGLVFVASLDRVVMSPSRSAVPYDASVADVTLEDLEPEVVDSPLVGGLTMIESAPIVLDGLDLHAHALRPVRGSLDVGIKSGRLPRTPDEITIGLRAAQDLDVSTGDTVTARSANREERELAVVGLAVIPPFDGEELGLNALLTPEGLLESGASLPFSGAQVQAADGVAPEELVGFLSDRFEADADAVPPEVENLEQLGGLPAAVAALVGAVAVLALANALVIAVRRRSGDLAVLRTFGFTRRQSAATVLVMAVAIVAVGILVGIPLGVAIGSTLWRITAEGAFILSDAHVRVWSVVLPAVGALVVALAAAAWPARQAARQTTAAHLRAE
jgi:hypothetical protein